MAKSKAFALIKVDILKIVSCIPKGKLTTYKSIGNYMDVVPRHVAYILSTLSDEEKDAYPWFRVIGENAKLGKVKVSSDGTTQESLLVAEGHQVDKSTVTNVNSVLVLVDDLDSGILRHKHYLSEKE